MVKVLFSSNPTLPRPLKTYQEIVDTELPTEFVLWSEKKSCKGHSLKWFSKHKVLIPLEEITLPHLKNLRGLLVKKIVEVGDTETRVIRGNYISHIKLRVPLSNWLDWVEYELSRRDAL